MAKPSRGGQRGTAWTRTPQPVPPNQPTPAQDTDENDDDSAGLDLLAMINGDDQQDDGPQSFDDINWNKKFDDLSIADYKAIYAANAASYDGSVTDAQKMYISNTDYDKQGHSLSQTMNYQLDNNLPLDANTSFMKTYLEKGLHPIGRDANLIRAAHDDVLQGLGVQNYQNYTAAQLQKMLVGTTFQQKAYCSYSVDKATNPFISGAPAGGREVFIKAKTAASTKVILGAQSQTEVVTGIGTHCRITNVYYDGTWAYPRNGSAKPRLIIEIDQY